MGKRFLLLAGLACALVSAGGAAAARDGGARTIVFTVQNVGFGGCADGIFAITFDMAKPGGATIGEGLSCVHLPSDCPDPPVPGCRGTAHATFSLALAGGTLTAPVRLHELWLTESKVLQVTEGRVTSGTGRFAGARGSIRCAGTIEFTEAGLLPRIACVVRLR